LWATFSDWRKQYVNKKKEKEARASPSPAAAVVVKKAKADSRENIISQIIDLMCRVDWQDYELRSVWTVLENLRSLVPAGGGKGAAA
jgi:transposase-like protein